MINSIFKNLEKIGKDIVSKSFCLKRSKVNNNICLIDDYNVKNLAEIIFYKKNERKDVKVLKWLNQFLLFIEIEAKLDPINIKKTVFPYFFISIVIFNELSESKHHFPLFRAEWDNYGNTSEEHSQPHWHIADSFQIPDNFINTKQESIDEVQSQSQKTSNIYKFHFAMNVEWANNGTDVHKLDNEEQLYNWFKGILTHIKKELIYIQKN